MMTFSSFATVFALFWLTGGSEAFIQVDQIDPHLSHRTFDVITDTSSPLARQLLPDIPGDEAAKQFLVKQFGYFPNQQYVVKNSHTSANGVTHIYMAQLINNKEVANGNINVNIGKDGNVISFGNSFYNHQEFPLNRALSSGWGELKDALKVLFNHINFNQDANLDLIVVQQDRSASDTYLLTNIPKIPLGGKASQKYIQSATGSITQAWDIEIDLDVNYLNAFITSEGEVVALYDWVHYANYNVYPNGVADPDHGSRQITTQQGTSNTSPLGWHDQGNGKKFTSTTGNNVIAYDYRDTSIDWDKASRAEGGTNLNFDFPLDLSKEPSAYINASITNLFYWNNMIHDVYYAHGFTETAGNFQMNNFGKGGVEGDPVKAQVQDGSGKNNANFLTRPDGEMGRMRMYIYNRTSPNRDGDLDNEIIVHEYTHGLSNRLTGGASTSNCLSNIYSRGMGEGWSDMMGIVFFTNPTHTRDSVFLHASYVNGGKTNRQYPYSTDFSTNPETFKTINKYSEVHRIGAVWCEILFEVYWNMINAAGFNEDLLSGKTDHGNTLFMQYIIDAFKLQPCNPSIIQARNAIIQAEEHLSGGKFKCQLWRGFAKRGLGTDATFENDKATDGNKVPDECKA